VQGALTTGSAADGLLQRLQMLVWPEVARESKLVDRRPDHYALERAEYVFRRLDALPTEETPRRFTPAAQRVFDDFLTQWDQWLRSGDLDHAPAYLSHMGKYRSLMPTIALLFHLAESDELAVSERAALKAFDWCSYLHVHARKVYAAELEADNRAARTLADKIAKGEVEDGATLRSIYRHHWTGLTTPDVLARAVALLEERHWLSIERYATGGAPTDVLRINPAVVP
jgi:hypothetical protein